MNERILELAIEARKYAETKPDIYSVAYDKKFAELIVQECIHTVRNRGGMCGALASDWIEEHFYGVEE